MIKAEKLSKKYGNKRIFKNISFNLGQGECLGIVGKNGSGKTSLVNLILNPKSANEGTIINTFSKKGIQFQDSKFDRGLKVKEIVDIYMNINDGSEEKLKKYSQALDLNIDKTAFENLSGGQKQKLSILCSIIHDPDIIYFDEITSGLDYLTRQEIYKIIKSLKDEGKSIVLVTHYFEELNDLADKVLIINKGTGKVIEKQQKYEAILKEEIK
jgi:ABC-2 type transport system ATP-binding protein